LVDPSAAGGDLSSAETGGVAPPALRCPCSASWMRRDSARPNSADACLEDASFPATECLRKHHPGWTSLVAHLSCTRQVG